MIKTAFISEEKNMVFCIEPFYNKKKTNEHLQSVNQKTDVHLPSRQVINSPSFNSMQRNLSIFLVSLLKSLQTKDSSPIKFHTRISGVIQKTESPVKNPIQKPWPATSAFFCWSRWSAFSRLKSPLGITRVMVTTEGLEGHPRNQHQHRQIRKPKQGTSIWT